jgi:hypothetical protein
MQQCWFQIFLIFSYLIKYNNLLNINYSEFENKAIGVLEVFDKNTKENVVDVLVIRYLKELGMDCLELAVLCKCERFVSNTTVQRILDYIWSDTRNKTIEMVST